MKCIVKKFTSLILAVLMLITVFPFAAYAAKYENPAFKISVASETGSEVVVTVDLESGKFNCLDFGFTAKSGYTCTKIAKGSLLSAFIDECEDKGKTAPLFVSNYKTGIVSFASSVVYDKKGAMVKATFSKSKNTTYKPGDISVNITNCAISEGDKSISLSPTVSNGSATFDIVMGYHDAYQIPQTNEKGTFSTSNKKVAAVNDKGLIHAGIKGNATITANYGSYVVYYNVTVKFNFGQTLMYYVLFGFLWMKPEKF